MERARSGIHPLGSGNERQRGGRWSRRSAVLVLVGVAGWSVSCGGESGRRDGRGSTGGVASAAPGGNGGAVSAANGGNGATLGGGTARAGTGAGGKGGSAGSSSAGLSGATSSGSGGLAAGGSDTVGGSGGTAGGTSGDAGAEPGFAGGPSSSVGGAGPAPGFACRSSGTCETGQRCITCEREDDYTSLCVPDPTTDPEGYGLGIAECVSVPGFTECDGPEDCAEGTRCAYLSGALGAACVTEDQLPAAPLTTCCFTCSALPVCTLCWTDADCPAEHVCMAQPEAPRGVGGCRIAP